MANPVVNELVPTAEPTTITWATLGRFLLGNAQAIRALAAAPESLWLGFGLTITAGLARDYDGEDLLHEPWRLLIPPLASLGTSFILYVVLWLTSRGRIDGQLGFVRTYRRFLSLYWLTAPLAWLYAVPFERFLSAGDATTANLAMLTLVAVWRVLLITRVTWVLFEVEAWMAFFAVILFADGVALALLSVMPWPVLNIMGGIRHTPSEERILAYSVYLTFALVYSSPLWLLGTGFATAYRHVTWAQQALPCVQWGRTVWRGLGFACLAWAALLPFTQGEQIRRWRVERDLEAGRLAAAVERMSAYESSDFPPHWDPPPRLGYGERVPDIVEVVRATLDRPCAPWVRDLFLAKLFGSIEHGERSVVFWCRLTESERELYLDMIESSPRRAELVAEHREGLLQFVDHPDCPAEHRPRIEALLASEPETTDTPDAAG